MKNKIVASLTAVALVAASLVGCGGNANTSGDTTTPAAETQEETTPAANEEEEEEEAEAETETEVEEEEDSADAGFTEHPVEGANGEFSDIEVGFLNCSAVYFQAVPMENETKTISADDSDIHIEVDVQALENDLGFAVGEWVPYLTIDYDITTADGASVASGTLMHMAASDGPHYGANIKLDPGTYNFSIKVHSPGENEYLIHSDAETGPGGSLAETFKDGPFTYTFEGWDFAGLE